MYLSKIYHNKLPTIQNCKLYILQLSYIENSLDWVIQKKSKST